MTQSPDTPTIGVEEGLKLAAYIVLRHGEAAAPALYRLERKYAAHRQETAGADRARRILDTLVGKGATRALAV